MPPSESDISKAPTTMKTIKEEGVKSKLSIAKLEEKTAPRENAIMQKMDLGKNLIGSFFDRV